MAGRCAECDLEPSFLPLLFLVAFFVYFSWRQSNQWATLKRSTLGILDTGTLNIGQHWALPQRQCTFSLADLHRSSTMVLKMVHLLVLHVIRESKLKPSPF